MTPGEAGITNIFADAAGVIARQALDVESAASLLGVTSRGAFLLLPSGRVVFLSTEAFRGPLTVNLHAGPSWLRMLSTGSQAEMSRGKVFFPACGLSIQMPQASSWSPPPPAAPALPAEARLARLLAIAGRTLALQQGGQGGLLLREALAGDSVSTQVGTTSAAAIPRVRAAISSASWADITASLEPLLGLGAGLTPAGDDLIAGLLLASTRWGKTLHLAWDPAVLAGQIIALARQRTTALSASLIACAGQGLADERLMLALDGIMTGYPQVEACAESLAAWGASSGGDCLAGMSLAIAASVV